MTVTRRDGEAFEELFRRFKAQVTNSRVLQDIKKKRFFRSKAVIRRDKQRDAERRRRRKERRHVHR